MSRSALDGLKVVDLSRLFPGPYATQLLADYGAEVIKVEETGGGDYMRSFAPVVDGTSAFFLNLNRNKKSVALNLKHPEGARLLLELVKGADVVVESFRPGVAERLGVGFDTLRRANPRLIYCAVTGYGQTGPMKDRAGHDINYLALSGLLSLNRDAEGRPVVPGFQVADVGGGAVHAVVGILLALLARERTGEGQFVDVAMVDALAPWQVFPWSFLQAGGDDPVGSYLSGEYPCYAVYEAADGKYLALGALEEKFWANFCRAVGRPEWIGEQFARGPARETLFAAVRALLKTKGRDVWAGELAGADCCATPVLETAELAADPHWRARGLVLEGAAPPGALGFPVRLSATPATLRAGVPALGQHTGEVLASLGMTEEEVGKLRAAGAVG